MMIAPYFYLIIIIMKAENTFFCPNIMMEDPLNVNYIFTPPMFVQQTMDYSYDFDPYTPLENNKAVAIPIYDKDFDKKLDEVTISFANKNKIDEEFGAVEDYSFNNEESCVIEDEYPMIDGNSIIDLLN